MKITVKIKNDMLEFLLPSGGMWFAYPIYESKFGNNETYKSINIEAFTEINRLIKNGYKIDFDL